MGSGPGDQVEGSRQEPPSASGPRRRRWLLPLVAVISLAGIGGWIAVHWGLEETDNAQPEGDLTEISARLPGTVDRAAVQDNQQVRQGQLTQGRQRGRYNGDLGLLR